VILGHMVPTGTGFKSYHLTKVKKNVPEPQPERSDEDDEGGLRVCSRRAPGRRPVENRPAVVVESPDF
jgi:hypothetical protein